MPLIGRSVARILIVTKLKAEGSRSKWVRLTNRRAKTVWVSSFFLVKTSKLVRAVWAVPKAEGERRECDAYISFEGNGRKKSGYPVSRAL